MYAGRQRSQGMHSATIMVTGERQMNCHQDDSPEEAMACSSAGALPGRSSSGIQSATVMMECEREDQSLAPVGARLRSWRQECLRMRYASAVLLTSTCQQALHDSASC